MASAARRAEIVGATSTGAFVLAAAGLLDGHRATTHPDYAERLRGLGADCVAQPWVHDGRYLTAAGVSGAIDMTLQFVARLKGEAAAKDIQLVIEYDPDPPFGGLAHGHTPHTRDQRRRTS